MRVSNTLQLWTILASPGLQQSEMTALERRLAPHASTVKAYKRTFFMLYAKSRWNSRTMMISSRLAISFCFVISSLMILPPGPGGGTPS